MDPPTFEGSGQEAHLILAKGDLACMIRDFAWSDTPLGAISTWSESLLSSVNSLLSSKFPMVLYWGPQLITIYNDGYVPIFGSKHPWGLGKPVAVAWSEIWKDIEPMFRCVMQEGEPTWSKDQLLLMNRHGYMEECYFTWSFSPVFTKGCVGGTMTPVIETTERVLNERRFATLRELGSELLKLRSVNDVANVTIRVLGRNAADVPFALIYLQGDDAGKMVLTGMPPGGLMDDKLFPVEFDLYKKQQDFGWPIAQVLQGDSVLEVNDLQERLGLFPGCPWPNEYPRKAVLMPLKLVEADNSVGVLILGINPRRTFDDAYRGFVQLIQGQLLSAISMVKAYEKEQKRSESLMELDRAKTMFFSNISHEFRTPLTLILGPVEELLSDEQHPLCAEHLENVTLISRNAVRLLKLVNSLLDFSRIQEGRMQASYEPTNISALTFDLLSTFRSTIEHANLELITDIPPIEEEIHLDKEMFEKIVFNLLSNAFKFTWMGSISVSLRLKPGEGVVELRVKDTGVGIPPNELPRMFERFHRVENTHGRSYEGSGIGLALTHDLVKLHGGSISVESVLGHGSSFIVRFPLGKDHLPETQLSAKRDQVERIGLSFVKEQAKPCLPPTIALLTAPKLRVLVADDNQDMCQHIKNVLSTRWDVEVVHDGEAALQSLQTRVPDLILSDVMMPKLNGFELLREVRKDAVARLVPFVMLSARAGEEARIEGLQAGADDYLCKPFSSNELVARVKAQLKLGQLRIRLEQQVIERTEELFRTNEALQAEARDRLKVERELRYQSTQRAMDAEAHQKKLSEFVDTLCHEIRNPLNCICGGIALLQEPLSLLGRLQELETPKATLRENFAPVAAFFKSIEVASELLRAVVDDVLHLSKLDNHQVELTIAPFDLQVILQELAQMFRVQAEKAGLKFTLEVPVPEALWLRGDHHQLTRVLCTLLSNAIKFTAFGEITLSTTIESIVNDDVVLRFVVRDTGRGISDPELACLFDRFAQLNRRKMSANATGSGLGLAICKRLLEMMGGTIVVTSRENVGSEFTVHVPCSVLAPQEKRDCLRQNLALVPPSTLPLSVEPRKKRILVVDDNVTNRQMLCLFLKMRGFMTQEAVNGLEAVNMVKEANALIDLIFMDIEMPLMDGIEATRQIRARERSDHATRIPIIALSGYTSEQIQQEAAIAGMEHFLTKPFKRDTVYGVVDKFTAVVNSI
jgi:signal transduction histidine kinase